VSVTPISKVWHRRQRFAGGLLLALVASAVATTPPHAAEQRADEGGFFSYFPAPPKLNLPNLDIFHLWTSDAKIGRKAYNSNDYAKALKYFRKSSEDGNSVADWYLGHMYRLGRGVSQDQAIAYSYYSRVAESYDPDDTDPGRIRIIVDSQLHLTSYVQQGLPQAGIKADPQLAAKNYLRIASNHGHPRAMFELGRLNLLGLGVTANPQQGLKWLIAAARKRDVMAEAYLGDLYWRGEFVRRDETRALMWYALATDRASQTEFPGVFQRHASLRQAVDEEVRLEADARAKVWAEQYPVKKRD
jgi:uncharacterized protein